jgi:hypothetical protein
MKTETTTRVMVMATATGFYRNVLVTRGQTFALVNASDFSDRWMVKAAADAPDTIPAADPKRQTRPGERPADAVVVPTPAPAKPGGPSTVKPTPTGDQAVI